MPVLIKNQQRKIKLDTEQLCQKADRLLEKLGLADRELGILLLNDRQIRNYNRQYLGRDCPTNVMSFSMSEGEFSEMNRGLFGDILISAETAARQAEEAGINPNDEIVFLIIHGILHIAGYDHENGSDEKEMRKKESALFSSVMGHKLARYI